MEQHIITGDMLEAGMEILAPNGTAVLVEDVVEHRNGRMVDMYFDGGRVVRLFKDAKFRRIS